MKTLTPAIIFIMVTFIFSMVAIGCFMEYTNDHLKQISEPLPRHHDDVSYECWILRMSMGENIRKPNPPD